MKIVGYLIFAMFYYLFRIGRVNENKVFCIMTHDSAKDSSVGVVVQALKKSGRPYQFYYIKKQDRGRNISFFIKKPYHMATSKYILQDNVFLPMAFMRFKKDVKVVQLWHGTGTIKKFGQDVNVEKYKKEKLGLGTLEKKANATISHLIVNSEYTKRQYQGAFGIDRGKVFVLGLPRTDVLFNKDKRRKGMHRFYQNYPYLKDKKILLYAPTFRDDEIENPRIKLNLEYVSQTMPKNMAILLRLHPHVARAYNEEKGGIMKKGNVINVSDYPELNHLLFVADTLITDYSSIIFEYCLIERPIYFYAYDLERFKRQGRGFYEEYESYVPGPVSRTTEEMLKQILDEPYDLEKLKRFKEESYQFLDGNSTGRLLEEVFHI